MRAVEQVTFFCVLTTVWALAAADDEAAYATCTSDSTDPTCTGFDDDEDEDSLAWGDAQSSLVLAVSLTKNLSEFPSFAAFIQEHSRTYAHGSKEYELRRRIYTQSLEKAAAQNSKKDRRWDAGVNHLSDRTEEELKQLRGSRPMHAGASKAVESSVSALNQEDNFVIPDEKSWTHLNSVKAVSDQGGCGSCWAVATATTLSANAEAKGHLHSFSAQELVDCVPNPHTCGGSGGCKGNTVELAMNWIMEEGLSDLTETPYLGQDTQCKKTVSLLSPKGHNDHNLETMIAVGLHEAKSATSPGLALGLKRWERLPENEYEPLIRAVAEHGPVAVSIGADKVYAYSKGVFDGCGKDSVINHAVTLVGYGKDATSQDKFWLIKNSWGPSWGEEGFIRMLREEGKVHCGTDNKPEVGTGCDGGPKSVKVCGMCGILYDSVVPHFEQKV